MLRLQSGIKMCSTCYQKQIYYFAASGTTRVLSSSLFAKGSDSFRISVCETSRNYFMTSRTGQKSQSSVQNKQEAIGQLKSPFTEQQQESGNEPVSFQKSSSTKQHKNVPFVKNLFLGNFDTNMLVFPEALSKNELQMFETDLKPIEEFLTSVDSEIIDKMEQIPSDVISQLKSNGLFGLQIPKEFGGLELNATGLCRVCELTGLNASINIMLMSHYLVTKGIILAGTDEIKAKYLPKLASGEQIAAYCLTEKESGGDAAAIQTTATLADDEKHYLLNGEKTLVTNGTSADVFLVFAKIKVKTNLGAIEPRVSALLVDRSCGGVTSGHPEPMLGARGSNISTVSFTNTPVPVQNVIGTVGAGFQMALTLMNNGRFYSGAAHAGYTRHLLGKVTEHAIQRKQMDRPLKDYGIIQDKLANIAINIYAMESLSYLTAGVIDSYMLPDIGVESAIIKVFSSEMAARCVNECQLIVGGAAFLKSSPIERLYRDCRSYMFFEGTNEVLRLFIALTCLQHAGLQLSKIIKKLMDPLNNLGFVFRKQMQRFRTERSQPHLTMRLHKHVHPDLGPAAEALEVRTVRFQYIVEKYLSGFGDKVVHEQMALRRMADVAIDLYTITACVARASRSKCIGLRNHDHEVMLTRVFVQNAIRRIDVNFDDLNSGFVGCGDFNLQKISDMLVKNHGYASEHPLTRNW